ncbi:MAG: cation transporter [Cytophagaceae bacterium]|nr:cation transporter [Cytophagaceae bacterium]
MQRRLFLGTAFAVLTGSVTLADDTKPQTVKIKTSAICKMCKARIERNLAYEKGVTDVTLDVDTKVATVTFNPKKTDVAKIKANIVKTGYDADEISADPKGYDKLPNCCKKGGEKLMQHQ